MSAREFAEWVAYAGIEPFGETRADIRIATLAALFAEANRDRKRRRKAFSVGEFVALFRGGSSSPESESASAFGQRFGDDGTDVERKKTELWANVKAWAMRGQRASARAPAGSQGLSVGSVGQSPNCGSEGQCPS